MSNLDAQFNEAVAFIRSGEGSYKPSQSEQLEFYGLYKQATEGDVSGKKPGMLDITGRAKYNAWADRKGMSANDAKQAYVTAFEQRVKG